jgi:hypothetical protein
MPISVPNDVVAAIREFVERVHAIDPAAEAVGAIDVRVAGEVDGDEARLLLSTPAVRGLIEALRGYHDPRDRGLCDHCSGRRLDHNFRCLDCGRPNGVFGAMVMERAARYGGDPPPLGGDDTSP